MDMYGFRMWSRILRHTERQGIGCLRIMAGLGFRIIAGDGHVFIMVAGNLTSIMDGYGFRDMNGRLHGLPGEDAPVIMAGLRWDIVILLKWCTEIIIMLIMTVGFLWMKDMWMTHIAADIMRREKTIICM